MDEKEGNGMDEKEGKGMDGKEGSEGESPAAELKNAIRSGVINLGILGLWSTRYSSSTTHNIYRGFSKYIYFENP